MEPTAEKFVNQYLEAGGAPFNTMNLLMTSYEGLAAMANMVNRDMTTAFGPSVSTAITDAVGRKIVESFDPQKAD
ncbi:hypothetical protein IWW55_006246, partial [Coemansia sp. RSA 2706]